MLWQWLCRYHISVEDATYVQHTTAFSTYLDRRSVMWFQQFNAFAILWKKVTPCLNNYRHLFFQTDCKKHYGEANECERIWPFFRAINWPFAHFRPNSVQNCEFRFSVQSAKFPISSVFRPKRNLFSDYTNFFPFFNEPKSGSQIVQMIEMYKW